MTLRHMFNSRGTSFFSSTSIWKDSTGQFSSVILTGEQGPGVFKGHVLPSQSLWGGPFSKSPQNLQEENSSFMKRAQSDPWFLSHLVKMPHARQSHRYRTAIKWNPGEYGMVLSTNSRQGRRGSLPGTGLLLNSSLSSRAEEEPQL